MTLPEFLGLCGSAFSPRSSFKLALCVGVLVATGCASTSTSAPQEAKAKAHAKTQDSTVSDRLARATAIGRDLHRRDLFAWWATDLALPHLGPEDADRFRGWLCDADDPSTVHFLIEVDGELFTRLLVRCDGNGPQGCAVESPSAPVPLSDRNLAQRRAVQAAYEHPEFVPTSDRYNHVVIPTDESNWWVYLIAATTDPNLRMFGRHYRFLVSQSGEQVLEWRAFSETALVVDVTDVPSPDAVVHTVVVSHILDEIPTEMHVWVALNYHTPVGVVIGPDMWMIDETGTISLVPSIQPIG